MRQSKEAIQSIVNDYYQSGMSVRVYAKQKGINNSTLNYWLKKGNSLEEKNQTKGFKKVKPNVELHSAEVIYPNGVRIVLYSGLTSEQLVKLIQC